MKRFAFIALALAGLAACEPVPQNGMNPAAEEVFANKEATDVFKPVSDQVLFSTFAKVCEANLKNPAGYVRTAKSMGYIVLGRDRDIVMYADPSGQRPLLGLAGPNPARPEFCMVLVPDTAAVRASVQRNIGGRSGAIEVPIKGLAPGAEKAWVTNSAIYITVAQRDPAMGKIFGLGVGPT